MQNRSFRRFIGLLSNLALLSSLLLFPIAGCSSNSSAPTAPGIEQTVVKPGAEPTGGISPFNNVYVTITMTNTAPWAVEVGLPASGRHYTLNPGTSVTVTEMNSSTVKVTYLAYSVTKTLPTKLRTPYPSTLYSASGTVVRTAPGIFVIQTP